MIISHKFRFIFIKTRKTAGTSLEVFLSSICGADDIVTEIKPHVDPHQARNFEEGGFFNHISGIQIKEKINPDVWNGYFKFCVERNPWDKTLSHYYMLNKAPRDHPNHIESLDDFFNKNQFPVDHEKYTDADGQFLVDEILRYENLNADLSRVLGALGIPFSGALGIWAKSQYRTDRRHYSEILSQEQADTVATKFAKEIAWFGYKY